MGGAKTMPFLKAIEEAGSIRELLPLRLIPGGLSSTEGQENYLNKLKCLTISEAIESTDLGDKCFSISLGIPGVDVLLSMKKILLELVWIDEEIPEFEPVSKHAQCTLMESVNSALKEVLDRQV